MDPEFIKYRDFFEKETADELIQLLVENGIVYEVEEFRDVIPSAYQERMLSMGSTVKLRQADFQKVDTLLGERAKENLNEIDESHYLYGFSNDELLEVLSKHDEWSEVDYELSKKLLDSRGVRVSDAMLSELKNARLKELSAPEPKQVWLVRAGYLLALIGGFLGILIGWYLMTYKKVLPNGERLYGYSRQDRAHGKLIFIIGIAIALILALLKMYRIEVWRSELLGQ
jgi:predicted HTH domain antitoxin